METTEAPEIFVPTGDGGGGEPTAPAAEPTAPAAEPTAPAVTHETFGWDEWDGQSFDAFPEEARGWVQGLHGRLTTQQQELQKQLEAAQAEQNHYQDLYEAVSYGKEDPRISQQAAQIASFQQQVEEAHAALEKQQQEYNSLIERDGDAYMALFMHTYGDVFEKDPSAADAVIGLAEVEFSDGGVLPLHEAMKIVELGHDAVKYLSDWASKTTKDVAMELVQAKFKKAEPAPPPPPKPAPSPSEQVVAGARPSPPALPKPKAPDTSGMTLEEKTRLIVAEAFRGR